MRAAEASLMAEEKCREVIYRRFKKDDYFRDNRIQQAKRREVKRLNSQIESAISSK